MPPTERQTTSAATSSEALPCAVGRSPQRHAEVALTPLCSQTERSDRLSNRSTRCSTISALVCLARLRRWCSSCRVDPRSMQPGTPSASPERKRLNAASAFLLILLGTRQYYRISSAFPAHPASPRWHPDALDSR